MLVALQNVRRSKEKFIVARQKPFETQLFLVAN